MQLKHQEALTTWRDDEQVISTDPRGMSGGDVTSWEYNDASGMEVKKTYADGRIDSASFRHGGAERKFTYGYLAGSNLLQSLAMPNKVTLTQTWEEKRDLLAEMLYTRLNDAGKKVEVTRRGYAYDALGRTTSRTQDYPQQSVSRDDSFDYNRRSELTGATLGEAAYAYAYDNIGNRITAQEDAESVTYEANNLNQYTQIDTDGTAFVPEYDADGNQTRVQTATGIWIQENGSIPQKYLD